MSRFNPFLMFRVLSSPYLRLTYRLMRDRRVPFRIKLIPVLSVAYVLMPVDLFPDFLVPLLSQIDDFLVLVLGLNLFLRLAPPHVVREHFRP